MFIIRTNQGLVVEDRNPEYAKVLNAIDFIGIKVKINGENIDLPPQIF